MTKISRFVWRLGLILLTALPLATACVEEEIIVEEPPYLTVSQNAIVASQETAKFSIYIESNIVWTVSSRAEWAKVYGQDGSDNGAFDIVVDSNASLSERSTEVVVSGAGCTAVIAVVQSSSELSLVTPVTDYYIGADAQDLLVDYLVSSDEAIVKAFSNTDWLEVKGVADSQVSLSAAMNKGSEVREAEVKITGTGEKGKTIVNTVTIHQGATENILDVLVDSLSIAALGETVKVPVQTNAEISASCSSDWCSVAVSEKNVLISAGENVSGITREAVVTVSIVSDKGKPLSKAITVTQESLSVGVNIPINEYTIDCSAQEVSIKYILSSQDYEMDGVSSAKWAQITSISDGVALVSVEKNDSYSERSAEIALTATNASGIAITAKTTIKQGEKAKDTLEILVPEVNAKADGETLRIPFNSSTDVKAKSSAYWCTVSIDDKDIVVEVSKNIGPAREAYISLYGGSGLSGTVKVTQAQSVDSIDLPVKELSAQTEGETIRIPFTATSISKASSNVDWCKVSIEDGYIVATVDANASTNIREAYITVTTTEGNSGIVHILQAARGEDTLEVLTPEVNVVYKRSTINVPFASNAKVSARSSVTWMSVNVKGSDVEAVISENTLDIQREGYITLTTEGGAVAVAHITQAPAKEEPVADAYLTVVVDRLYIQKEGGSLNIPYTSCTDVSAASTASWLSLNLDKKNNIVHVQVEENNTGKDRSAFVVISNISGLSCRTEIIQLGAGTLYVAVTEFTMDHNGGVRTIPYQGDGAVSVTTTESWITAGVDGNGLLAVSLAENTGEDDREGYVVLTDQSDNVAYVHVYQTGDKKSADELKALVTTIYFTGHESTIKVPITADNIEGPLTVKSSSDWLTGSVSDLDIVVDAPENWTGSTRTGYLTVTTPEGVVALITVTQTSLTPKFEFEDSVITLPYTAESSATLLISTGAWEIVDSDHVPGWLTISPQQGDGNAIINIAASANKFASSRSTTVYFQNTSHNMTAKMTVSQDGNPNGLVEFLHLGKGYDVSGKYAEEAYVKAKVLDPDKLVAGDHIADLLTPNATVEEVVTGRTLEEYEDKYSVNAGVSGSYRGFSASVEFNFSEHALGTSEYSYATLRHMTKKQILKIYEDEKAADLKSCLTDLFIQDVQKALESKGNADKLKEAANLLVDKYGTHVITGFSLGGVLEYSMAADATSNESETDWGLAVKAGFEKEGIGSASTEDSYNQYSRLKNESDGFESKLVCRGGESQYTSSGYGEDAGKVAQAYESWLTSLEDKSKWVMVDYEGSRLIPLWDFVDDAQLSAAIDAVAQERLCGLNINQTSDKREFQLLFVGMETTHRDNDKVENTEWELTLKCKVDGKGELKTLYDTHDRDDAQIDVMCSVDENNMVRTNVGPYTSGVFRLSKSQSHQVVIQLTGCYEKDDLNKDWESDTNLTLKSPAGADYWSYESIRTTQANMEFKVYDKDAAGKQHEILMYPLSDANGTFVRFIFQIVWK